MIPTAGTTISSARSSRNLVFLMTSFSARAFAARPQLRNRVGTAQNGRCGYGPRLPLLVTSPFAKQNHVDHRVTDQSSILRFIEDNWSLGRIGNGSTDVVAGKLDGMFVFRGASAPVLILDPATGVVLP